MNDIEGNGPRIPSGATPGHNRRQYHQWETQSSPDQHRGILNYYQLSKYSYLSPSADLGAEDGSTTAFSRAAGAAAVDMVVQSPRKRRTSARPYSDGTTTLDLS